MMTSTSGTDVLAPDNSSLPTVARPWTAIVMMALAGGMGWGIRGQYGHETGAMIAGVLMGFAALLLFARHLTSLAAARAVALFTVGISLGGSMTYGQTIGLTHDAPLIGNWAALRWGMLGLFIKGGIWMGFAGLFLGMGLSGKRYRPAEMFLLLLGMAALMIAGMWLLNRPFDPQQKVLPRIYFSDDWYWEPDGALKPRPECWGGLLAALVGLTAYVHWARRDRLARNLALSGMVAGIGFPLGQSLQAFHAWNPEYFQAGWLGQLDPHINWWNMMEITFGATAGGVLAIALWINRRWIAADQPHDDAVFSTTTEIVLCAAHVALLVCATFLEQPLFELYVEFGLLMSLIPLLGILGGRYWPYFFVLPIVTVPIAGKTLRELAYQHNEWSVSIGWLLLVALPLATTFAAALWLARRHRSTASARQLGCQGLLLTTWLYFVLNWLFFRCPWPWAAWTGRTPSGIIFLICSVGLTIFAVASLRSESGPRSAR